MNTSPTSLWHEAKTAEVLSDFTLEYFRENFRNALHTLIIEEFSHQKTKYGLTGAALAKRIKKKPEQIARWLGAPGNLTVDTVSDLLLGMRGELESSFRRLDSVRSRNSEGVPDWMAYTSSESGSSNVVLVETKVRKLPLPKTSNSGSHSVAVMS